MWSRVLCLSVLFVVVPRLQAGNFLDSVLDVLTELGDAMVTIENPKLVANDADVKSEKGRTQFRIDEKEIVILFGLSGVATGESITSVWSRKDGATYQPFGTAELTVPEDFNNKAHFLLELDNGKTRPAGHYKVDLAFKEKILHTSHFELVGPSTQSRPPRPPATPGTGRPTQKKAYEDKDFNLRAVHPAYWNVIKEKSTFIRFEMSPGMAEGPVNIGLRQFGGKSSHGGLYENLQDLANAVKLHALDNDLRVSVSEQEPLPYIHDGLRWPGITFELNSVPKVVKEAFHQRVVLIHDKERDLLYSIVYSAPARIFDKYAKEVGAIMDSFDFTYARTGRPRQDAPPRQTTRPADPPPRKPVAPPKETFDYEF